MMEQESPRTRLAQLLRQRHLTLEEFRKQYQRAAGGTVLSERQAYRWVAGEVRSLPYPQAQATLEKMFGEPAARLFGPPYDTGALGSPGGTMGWSRRGAPSGRTGKGR